MEIRKKLVFDYLYNVIAYAIPVFVNQIIVQPVLGSLLNEELYGNILTLINLINLIPFTVGNTLNNIRLICNQKYLDNRVEGDFKILILLSSMLTLLLTVIGFKYYRKSARIGELFLFLLLSIIWFFREYYIVIFRLTINYQNILFNNLLMGLGYLTGLILFVKGYFLGYWELIYILGQFVSLVFISIKGNSIFKERYIITPLFSETLYMACMLLLANFLSVGLSNLDKLFIQPILGNTAVSIYHAATVFTKIVSTCTAPMAMVLLSYLSQKRALKRKSLMFTLRISFIVAVCGYFFCLSFGHIFIRLLYPRYYYNALEYIWITSANTMIALIISIIRPYTLKFCDIKWQILVGIISNLGYLGCGFLLIGKFDIWGICISYCISLLIQLFTYICILIKVLKNS